MTKVFISYSRKDKSIAGKLTEALEKSELETWIDWEDIPPTADWMEQIHKGIESADAFLFLLSPDSIQSQVCGKEVDHAVSNGKRLIPLVARDVNPGGVHPALAKVNWIYCREQDDFVGATGKLLSAIRTDLAWVEAHRRLQMRAIEWEKRKDNSVLLRGKDLHDAEEKLASVGQKDPQPTDLQRQFLLSSRTGETKARNFVIAAAIVVMVILAIASVIAVNQSNYAGHQAATALAEANARATAQVEAEFARATAVEEVNVRATAQAVAETEKRNAEQQAKIARAGEIAAQSVSLRGTQFDLSLLLSIEAFYTAETLRSKSVLLENFQTNPQLVRYLRQHTGSVNSVAFSPDGKLFASGGDDGLIILWEAATCQPVGQPLKGQTTSVSSVAFSPDGKTLASSSQSDKQVILWDVVTRQPIGQPLPGNLAAFSPDGKMLAYGSRDGTIVLWDLATHQPTGQPLAGYPKGVTSMDFSPDGKILASSGIRSGFISLWDLATRQLIGKIDPGGGTYSDNNVTFSPSGGVIASGGSDTVVILSNVEKRQFSEALPNGHVRSSAIMEIAFSPDGYMLASASTDNTIILWNAITSKQIGEPLVGHFNIVNSVAFSPDGKTLLSGSADGNVIVWDVAGEYQPLAGQPFAEQTGPVTSVAFSPSTDKKILASGSCAKTDGQDRCTESQITFWDMETRQPVGQPLIAQLDSIDTLQFSADGKVLVSGREYDDFLFWDVETRQPIGQPLRPICLTLSPDGKTIAFSRSEKDTVITLWDLKTWQPIGEPLTGPLTTVTGMVFSPDGKTLASGSSDGNLFIWDVATHKLLGQPIGGGDFFKTNLAFSPLDGGKTLAFAFANLEHTVGLWDATTLQVGGQPLKGADSIVGLVFSPDGKMLALDDWQGNLSLWDLATRQMIGRPIKGFGSWNVQPFSPDGTTLATIVDGKIVLWEMTPQAWAEKTCQRVSRNLTRAEWAEYFPGTDYRATCTQWPLELESTPVP